MKVKHLDHLNLSVRSFDESADWYNRVFGFEIVEKGMMDGKPWGVLKSGDAMLCIYEDQERKFRDRFSLRSEKLFGMNHFALRILDRQLWEQTVKKERVQVAYGGAYEYPHSTSWYINDPTGYEIEVVQWNNDTATF